MGTIQEIMKQTVFNKFTITAIFLLLIFMFGGGEFLFSNPILILFGIIALVIILGVGKK